MEEEKEKYCVYGHVYNGELFYVGSGEVYTTKSGLLRGRPYVFDGRSEDWKKFCNEEIDKVVVEILFETNDQRESLDVEEHITRMYIDRAHLVNKNFGIHPSPETRNKMSLAKSGENHPYFGKTAPNAIEVLITDNKTGETKIFDSIARVYEFILQNGFDKTRHTLQNYLRKGVYNFENYTIERIE